MTRALHGAKVTIAGIDINGKGLGDFTYDELALLIARALWERSRDDNEVQLVRGGRLVPTSINKILSMAFDYEDIPRGLEQYIALALRRNGYSPIGTPGAKGWLVPNVDSFSWIEHTPDERRHATFACKIHGLKHLTLVEVQEHREQYHQKEDAEMRSMRTSPKRKRKTPSKRGYSDSTATDHLLNLILEQPGLYPRAYASLLHATAPQVSDWAAELFTNGLIKATGTRASRRYWPIDYEVKPEEELPDEQRVIWARIAEQPGLTTAEYARLAGCNHDQAQNLVGHLRRKGLVETESVPLAGTAGVHGSSVNRVWPMGMLNTPSLPDIDKAVLSLLNPRLGTTPHDLAQALNTETYLIGSSLRRLVAQGKVRNPEKGYYWLVSNAEFGEFGEVVKLTEQEVAERAAIPDIGIGPEGEPFEIPERPSFLDAFAEGVKEAANPEPMGMNPDSMDTLPAMDNDMAQRALNKLFETYPEMRDKYELFLTMEQLNG